MELYLIQPAMEIYLIPDTTWFVNCHTHSSPIRAPVLEIIQGNDPMEIRRQASHRQFLEAPPMQFLAF